MTVALISALLLLTTPTLQASINQSCAAGADSGTLSTFMAVLVSITAATQICAFGTSAAIIFMASTAIPLICAAHVEQSQSVAEIKTQIFPATFNS